MYTILKEEEAERIIKKTEFPFCSGPSGLDEKVPVFVKDQKPGAADESLVSLQQFMDTDILRWHKQSVMGTWHGVGDYFLKS